VARADWPIGFCHHFGPHHHCPRPVFGDHQAQSLTDVRFGGCGGAIALRAGHGSIFRWALVEREEGGG